MTVLSALEASHASPQRISEIDCKVNRSNSTLVLAVLSHCSKREGVEAQQLGAVQSVVGGRSVDIHQCELPATNAREGHEVHTQRLINTQC